MKLRFALVAVAGLALSGCADSGFSFDDILGFSSTDQADASAAPAVTETSAVVTAQPGSATVASAQGVAPSTFCRGVASWEATQGVFDGPTQARVAQKSYAQCVAQFSAD
jgi:hypothetical protein